MPNEPADGRQQVSVRLTAAAVRGADVLARRKGVNRTVVIEMALREYLERNGVTLEGAGAE